MSIFPQDRLYAQLLNTGLQQKDPALYQVIYFLIGAISGVASSSSGSSGGGSSGGNVNNITQILGSPGLMDSEKGEDSIVPGPAGVRGLNGLSIPGMDGLQGEDAFLIPGPKGDKGDIGSPGIPGIDGESEYDPYPFYPPIPQDLTPLITQGRLTLESGVPVSTTDQSGKITVYFTPYAGNRIALFNGASWDILAFTEKSLAMPTSSVLPHDVWAYNNNGVVALEQTVWTNATTRATALVVQDGVLVKSGTPTRKYLGSYYNEVSTGDNGLCTDSARQRHLWNYYNRVDRYLFVKETTDTWLYSTATVRQTNADANNQVEILQGWAEDAIDIHCHSAAIASVNTVSVVCGVGEDTTTIFTVGGIFQPVTAGVGLYGSPSGYLNKIPAVGFHFYSWNEFAAPAVGGTATWQGDAGTAVVQTGLTGMWRC